MMKYFTFIDKDTFTDSPDKIWSVVLNVMQWPKLWKHVVDVNIITYGKIDTNSKIDCYFTLFYFLRLYFEIHIICLKKPTYASFSVQGSFSGQGRWILQTQKKETLSMLYLHLRTHHPVLRIISSLPYGKQIVRYSHRRVMLEGKKMILKKLIND